VEHYLLVVLDRLMGQIKTCDNLVELQLTIDYLLAHLANLLFYKVKIILYVFLICAVRTSKSFFLLESLKHDYVIEHLSSDVVRHLLIQGIFLLRF